MSLQTYGKWERGTINPPLERLIQLGDILGYDFAGIAVPNKSTNENYESELLNRCDTLEHKIDELGTIIKRMNDTIDHIEHNYLDKHKDCQ